MQLYQLENEHWQVGILPETGAAIAFGRIKHSGAWVDFMRPADVGNYGNVSLCASFPLLPFSNRLRDARIRFNGVDYALKPNKDGTAIHGTMRYGPTRVKSANDTSIHLRYVSSEHENVNFPFRFSGDIHYRLEGRDFVIETSLTNEDTQPFPGGFGHHPYFQRVIGGDAVSLELPYTEHWALVSSLPSEPPVPLPAEIDFQQLRALPETPFVVDHVLTGKIDDRPIRFVYGSHEIQMTSDPLFQQLVFYAPPEKPFYAVEPVTNTNDGFNLYDKGVARTGVFILQPGEAKSGIIRLSIRK